MKSDEVRMRMTVNYNGVIRILLKKAWRYFPLWVGGNDLSEISNDLIELGDKIITQMLNILMGIFFIHCYYINDEIAFSFEISNIFNEEIKFKRSCDVLRDEYMIEILNLLGVKNKKKTRCSNFQCHLDRRI
jgi:hypothetical protein